jgi:PAS domain S-box-containing protein
MDEKRILIIDDTPAVRHALADYLTDCGYETVTAEDGADGLAQARACQFHTVLVDLLMPRIDGLEVVATLTAEQPELPVVVVSGTGGLSEAVEAIRQGAWDYITKPIRDPNEITVVIERVMEKADLIAERVRAEEALQASNDRFAAVVNNLDTLVYVADMETYEILFANQAMQDAFGEVVGKTCWQVLHRDQSGPCAFCTNNKLLDADGQPTGVHIWESQSTITGQWYDVRDQAIRWVDGRLVRMEISTDITARKQAEEGQREALAKALQARRALKQAHSELAEKASELEAANAELSQYAYIVSHDLRAPIRALNNYSLFLQEDCTGQLDDQCVEYLEGIAESAQQMDKLVVDLLEYSSIGRVQVEKVEVDTGELLERIVRTLNLEEQAWVTLPADAPVVWAQSVRLEQIFANLLSNAVKFHRPDAEPTVSVTWADRGDGWEFSVHDNGIGITEQHHEKIFSIFQRLHTQEEYKGTGIGLAIVKKAVDQHGGQVWVESAVGRGSVFTFTLPKHVQEN